MLCGSWYDRCVVYFCDLDVGSLSFKVLIVSFCHINFKIPVKQKGLKSHLVCCIPTYQFHKILTLIVLMDLKNIHKAIISINSEPD